MTGAQTKIAVLPLIGLVAVYLSLSLVSLDGFLAYLAPSVCWVCLGFLALKIYGVNKVRLKFDRSLTMLAALTAATQIVLLVLIALFTSFGRSPYASSFLPLNILYFSSVLICTELVRAQLVVAFPKRRRLVGIALIALLFAFMSFSPARYISLGEPVETAEFLGSNLVPAVAGGLFATLLALLGGPVASVAYMGMLQAFELLSPILPNPGWMVQALVGTLAPAFGFLLVNESVTPFTLFRHGLISRKEALQKLRKTRRESSRAFGWLCVAFIGLVLLWSNTGLFGFQPSVVSSGSMQPNLNLGDMAILVHAYPDAVQIGDIIQYRTTDEQIIHRVIDKYVENGQTWFITKGDANNAADVHPVNEQQVVGKTTFTIPKLGWATIYIREAASQTYSFIMNLPQTATQAYAWITTGGVYITVSLCSITLSYAIFTNVKRKPEATE